MVKHEIISQADANAAMAQEVRDFDARLGYARRSVAWLNTSLAHHRDALIFRRLLKSRRHNKRARAYAEQPGELVTA